MCEVFAAWDAAIGERTLAQLGEDLNLPEQLRLSLAHAGVEIKMAKRAWKLKVRRMALPECMRLALPECMRLALPECMLMALPQSRADA